MNNIGTGYTLGLNQHSYQLPTSYIIVNNPSNNIYVPNHNIMGIFPKHTFNPNTLGFLPIQNIVGVIPANTINQNVPGIIQTNNIEGIMPYQNIYGTYPNMYGPNQNMSGLNPNMYGPNQNMSGLNPNMYGPNQNMSGLNPNMYGPNQNMYGPNQNIYDPNTLYGNNTDVYDPNPSNPLSESNIYDSREQKNNINVSSQYKMNGINNNNTISDSNDYKKLVEQYSNYNQHILDEKNTNVDLISQLTEENVNSNKEIITQKTNGEIYNKNNIIPETDTNDSQKDNKNSEEKCNTLENTELNQFSNPVRELTAPELNNQNIDIEDTRMIDNENSITNNYVDTEENSEQSVLSRRIREPIQEMEITDGRSSGIPNNLINTIRNTMPELINRVLNNRNENRGQIFIETFLDPNSSEVLFNVYNRENNTNNTEMNNGLHVDDIRDNTEVLLFSSIETDEEKCPICETPYLSDTIIRKINKCNHFCCISCLDKWLEQNDNCPHCKQEIMDIDSESNLENTLDTGQINRT